MKQLTQSVDLFHTERIYVRCGEPGTLRPSFQAPAFEDGQDSGMNLPKVSCLSKYLPGKLCDPPYVGYVFKLFKASSLARPFWARTHFIPLTTLRDATRWRAVPGVCGAPLRKHPAKGEEDAYSYFLPART